MKAPSIKKSHVWTKEHQVFIDPVCNFGNLSIFTTLKNSDLATDFINALFAGEATFSKVHLKPNEFVSQSVFSPAWIFAAAGKSEDNQFLILEMENKSDHFSIENRKFYVPNLLSNIIIKDKNADAYSTYKTFSINILNFILIDEIPDYIVTNKYSVKDKSQSFNKIITLKHIELPKFTKSATALESRLDKWLYALKHMKDLLETPIPLAGDPIFEKLFDIARIANLSPEELELYNSF